MNKEQLYRDAVDKWGPATEWRQLQEECGELIAAINRFDRTRCTEAELAEEVADVEILIEQARLMLGDELVDTFKRQKLERLAERLQED